MESRRCNKVSALTFYSPSPKPLFLDVLRTEISADTEVSEIGEA